MTSTARISNLRRGFTLLELVMVLVVAAMLMGGAAAYMVMSADDRALKSASGDLEALARKARAMAILQQTPYAIEFRPGSIRLMPLAQAGLDPGAAPAAPQASGGGTVALEGGITPFIRRWSTTNWLPMSDRQAYLWRFDPDGLCEPLGVRFQLGKIRKEDYYHPLTASIKDSVIESE